VRSLTLITPFVEAGPRLLAVIDAWCRVASEASPEAVARLVLPWMFSAEYLGDEGRRERTVRGLAATAARVPASTLVRAAAGMRRWSGSRRADLPHVSVPTLVLVAGGDLLTPDGEAVADAIPGARCRNPRSQARGHARSGGGHGRHPRAARGGLRAILPGADSVPTASRARRAARDPRARRGRPGHPAPRARRASSASSSPGAPSRR